MTKWEYGYIRYHNNLALLGNKRTWYWVLLTPDGLQQERLWEGKTHQDQLDIYYVESLPKFIAQLGLAGWEAYGESYSPQRRIIYKDLDFHFKRRIEE